MPTLSTTYGKKPQKTSAFVICGFFNGED